MPRDRASRVISFVSDFDCALRSLTRATHADSEIVLVLGARKVGGVPIHLPEIATDLLRSYGHSLMSRVDRPIPTKRMPSRNAISDTIGNESILTFVRDTNG